MSIKFCFLYSIARYSKYSRTFGIIDVSVHSTAHTWLVKSNTTHQKDVKITTELLCSEWFAKDFHQSIHVVPYMEVIEFTESETPSILVCHVWLTERFCKSLKGILIYRSRNSEISGKERILSTCSFQELILWGLTQMPSKSSHFSDLHSKSLYYFIK